MHWLMLSGAIGFEVIGTVSLKLSDGFTHHLYVGITIAAYLFSLGFLGLALKGLPVSTAYALWAGFGTALVAVVGMVALGETINALKVISIFLVVCGVIGLHLAEKTI